MNDICKIWSSPWHALQRDLASGAASYAATHPAARIAGITVERTAVAADSWLGRARLRATLTYVRHIPG
jgi:hypothetical protein